MNAAVCWKCGALKFGAFHPCPQCRAAPKSEEDLAISLSATEHFFDKPTLERIGAEVNAGKPLCLDQLMRRDLIACILNDGIHSLPWQDASKILFLRRVSFVVAFTAALALWVWGLIGWEKWGKMGGWEALPTGLLAVLSSGICGWGSSNYLPDLWFRLTGTHSCIACGQRQRSQRFCKACRALQAVQNSPEVLHG